MASPIYRFSEFRLDPARRELWRGDEHVSLPPKAFDCLLFLIENRDRVVTRDELISAVWRKPFVEEVQVSQRIMHARQAIGDSSHESQFIRTVHGYGYCWIAETEELPATPSSPVARQNRPAETTTLFPRAVSAPQAVRMATRGNASGSRWWMLAAAGLAAGLLVVATVRFGSQDGEVERSSPRGNGEAVAVLPLEVSAPDGEDAGWIRLGAMDLIADRLRDAGLTIPPSDGVVSALHAAKELPDAERLTAVRRILGAGALVEGRATRLVEGWKIALIATSANGDRRRVESTPAELVAAAGQAADLLLAAFGRQVQTPVRGDTNEVLSRLQQQARAALLAMELDTARSILTQAPESLRNAPELRHELAWIEFRRGRLDAADAIAAELLASQAVTGLPGLQVRALTLRAIVVAVLQEDWSASEAYAEAAVAVADGEPWTAETGAALAARGRARTGLGMFDAAAQDLGRARAIFEVGGDRLALSQVHNFFAQLDLERHRPADALPHIEAAIEISESFGHVEWLRANTFSLLRIQLQLLRWSDALITSESLWALRERVQDPVLDHYLGVAYATSLLGLGRHWEGEAVLADLDEAEAELPPRATRYSDYARARLAWQRGHVEEAMRAARRTLELWSARTGSAGRQAAGVALLYQRASIAAGRATPAAQALRAALGDTEGVDDDPTYLVAQAEWAAHANDHREAERLFRRAAARVESAPVPDLVVPVADAYARWLLAHGRVLEASALAGRVAAWADQDYDSALLQVVVLHRTGKREAWAEALRQAQAIAGEREIPAELLVPPRAEE